VNIYGANLEFWNSKPVNILTPSVPGLRVKGYRYSMGSSPSLTLTLNTLPPGAENQVLLTGHTVCPTIEAPAAAPGGEECSFLSHFNSSAGPGTTPLATSPGTSSPGYASRAVASGWS
jgi:hypothetical protein